MGFTPVAERSSAASDYHILGLDFAAIRALRFVVVDAADRVGVFVRHLVIGNDNHAGPLLKLSLGFAVYGSYATAQGGPFGHYTSWLESNPGPRYGRFTKPLDFLWADCALFRQAALYGQSPLAEDGTMPRDEFDRKDVLRLLATIDALGPFSDGERSAALECFRLRQEIAVPPSQSGNELCLNCKKPWVKHEARDNKCAVLARTVFEPSGRIEEPDPPRVEHHHHPAYMPQRQKCKRCHSIGHDTRHCDRMMARL